MNRPAVAAGGPGGHGVLAEAPAARPTVSAPPSLDDAGAKASDRRPEGEYRLIPIGLLKPAGDNPRQESGPTKKLLELAESIKEHGVLQPLVVLPAFGNFELVAGSRRLAAAKLAGLTEVPCIVRDVVQRRAARLVENMHRRDLQPIEEAEAIDELMERENLTQREVAAKLGRSQPWVSHRLALLTLPKATQRKVASGQIGVERALQVQPSPGPAGLFEPPDESSDVADVFAADEQVQRAWLALRQDAIDSNDRRTIRLLAEFAKAFKAYKAALEKRIARAGGLET